MSDKPGKSDEEEADQIYLSLPPDALPVHLRGSEGCVIRVSIAYRTVEGESRHVVYRARPHETVVFATQRFKRSRARDRIVVMVGQPVVSSPNAVAWFAVRVSVVAVIGNYLFGGVPVFAFIAGWLWGWRSLTTDEKENNGDYQV